MKKDKSFRKIPEKSDEEIEKIIKSKELTIKIEKRSKKKDIIIGITPIVKDNKAIEEKRKIDKELIENQRKYFEKQKKIVDERMKAELANKEEEVTRKNKMQEEIVTRQLKEQLIKREEDEKINKEDNEEKEKEKEKIKEEKMEEDDIDDSEQESIIEKPKVEEKKCSHEDHKENDAISFCQECNIFMCNKCDKMHSELFKNHIKYNIDKNMNDIFTGLCKEKNH